MKWQRYPQLERVAGMKNDGRELLGEEILVQEKRDGSNIALWLQDEAVRISSHNMEVAEAALVSAMQAVQEYPKICDLLKTEKTQYGGNYIAYGEYVPAGKGPTRIEPIHKKASWILFDLYDITAEHFEPYNLVYQKGYQFKIPVVKVIDSFAPKTLEEIQEKIKLWKAWARRHRREGVVGKVYGKEFLGFKEKIDLPDRPRIHKSNRNEIVYPPMPPETQLRSLQHAFEEVGAGNWKDKSKAMPVVAKHFNVEAREHNYSTPRNLFQLYLDAKIEELVKQA